MIRYGLVGIGGYAQVWLKALDVLASRGIARLAAAVVRNPTRYASEIARLQAQDVIVYPTMEAMLEDAQVNVIGIPTGIASHAPLAVQALEAGYPVLVEKPLAATIQEGLTLHQAEERSAHWCAVAYQWLYSPTIQALAALTTQGNLGRIRAAHCVIGWPRGKRYYTRNTWAGQLRSSEGWVLDGPATNATAHYLMNMLYLATRQVPSPQITAVRAELYRANPIPSYDTSSIEITLSDGARLYHHASHAIERAIEPIMRVETEKASILWHAETDTATITWVDGKQESITNPDMSWNKIRPLEQAAQVAAGREARPLCGVREALLHVLAINLAFESSDGIVDIPRTETSSVAQGEDSLTIVKDMDDFLMRAFQHGGTFSDIGVPWARLTPVHSARGYTHFPSERLVESLI